MKRWIGVALLAVIAGAVLTWAWQRSQATDQFASRLLKPAKATDQGPPPKLVLDETSYKFGKMDQEKKGSHLFEIGNEGPGELTLRIAHTSCGCTSVKLDDLYWNPKQGAPPPDLVRVAPGEKKRLELAWNTELRSGEFRTSAELETNDPDKPTVQFFVEGDIAPLVEVSSRQITVRSGRNDELTTEGFRIYSRILDDLKITDVDSSDPHISATFTPLPKLLESSQIASGYVGTVEIAPGLPQGPIQAQLTLHTNCAEHPEVTLQVVGRISGDVLMTPSENLDFKTLSVSKGETLKLFIKVRGESPVDVQTARVVLEPKSMEKFFKIDLYPVETGKNRYQLTAQVLPGAPGGLFTGLVELETTHPTDKLVKIPVRGDVIQ